MNNALSCFINSSQTNQAPDQEITKIQSGPGGTPSEFFLMAELFFNDEVQMQEAMGSPEGQTVVDDLVNFATGGMTILIGNTIQNLIPILLQFPFFLQQQRGPFWFDVFFAQDLLLT